ncbi:two-component system chemotaxis response regulator CheB [Oxalobacteraceae bacterium GrIS 1.11]
MSRPTRRIRVLVVDGSPGAALALARALADDAALEVIGCAADGAQAFSMAQHWRPDVILMDADLPGLGAYAATHLIMQRCPTRIMMLGAADGAKWREAGALARVDKPAAPRHARLLANLRLTARLMAEVPVLTPQAPRAPAARPIELVAIGASTGGPLALHAILSRLRPGFAAPIAIVQHMSAGFTAGFADWLARSADFPVRLAQQAEVLQAGVAYLAPDGMQMRVQADRSVRLNPDPPEYGVRPSVSYLFRSVAAQFGPRAVGVLLTGMGRDGALELKLMREAGALTMAQDAASCVVFGMPGEAVLLDAALQVLAPAAIAAKLNTILETWRAPF